MEPAGEGSGPRAVFTLLPTSGTVAAFRDKSPLRSPYSVISKGMDWQADTRTPLKAYLFSCFSELTYLYVAAHEVAGHDRYKLFPSLALRQLISEGLRIDFVTVLQQVGDIFVEIIELERFIYFVFRTNQFMVIAVRGTASGADWTINVNARKRGGYHLGFYDEAARAMPALVKAVGDANRVYFTGHSLGGAVAGVLGQIWPEPSRRKTPYVYASPRFGSREVVRRLPPFGYVAPRDIVPHLPPAFLGFADAGCPPIEIRTEVHWISDVQSWIWPDAKFAAPHWIERYRAALGREVSEDFPETVYVDALLRQIKNQKGSFAGPLI